LGIYKYTATGTRSTFLSDAYTKKEKFLDSYNGKRFCGYVCVRIFNNLYFVNDEGKKIARLKWTGEYDGAMFNTQIKRNWLGWKKISWKSHDRWCLNKLREYFENLE
jgi:hypothetical protein